MLSVTSCHMTRCWHLTAYLYANVHIAQKCCVDTAQIQEVTLLHARGSHSVQGRPQRKDRRKSASAPLCYHQPECPPAGLACAWLHHSVIQMLKTQVSNPFGTRDRFCGGQFSVDCRGDSKEHAA